MKWRNFKRTVPGEVVVFGHESTAPDKAKQVVMEKEEYRADKNTEIL